MRIAPTSQNFGMKWQIKKYKTIDGYNQEVKEIVLNNGNNLRIYTETKNGQRETKLQYLVDKTGKWLKSKLNYYCNEKVFKTIKSKCK